MIDILIWSHIKLGNCCYSSFFQSFFMSLEMTQSTPKPMTHKELVESRFNIAERIVEVKGMIQIVESLTLKMGYDPFKTITLRDQGIQCDVNILKRELLNLKLQRENELMSFLARCQMGDPCFIPSTEKLPQGKDELSSLSHNKEPSKSSSDNEGKLHMLFALFFGESYDNCDDDHNYVDLNELRVQFWTWLALHKFSYNTLPLLSFEGIVQSHGLKLHTTCVQYTESGLFKKLVLGIVKKET